MQNLIENLEQEIMPLMKMHKVFLNLFQNSYLQGSGLKRQKSNSNDFYSFRPYIEGTDDCKRLNWKLMAKYQKPFVTETEIQTEFSPYVMLDSSASMQSKKKKVLAIIYFLLKIANGQKFNLFWEASKRLQIPAKKGIEKLIISQVASINLKGENNLPTLIQNLRIPPKSSLIIITDLLEFDHWSDSLKSLYKKHNLLLIHLSSKFDHSLPQIGYVHIKNPETGKLLLLNSSDNELRKVYKSKSENQEKKIYDSLKPFINIWKICTDLPLEKSIQAFFS